MSKSMSLGERMKMYESQETGRALMPGLPVLARLDGRAFHTWCKGLDRPYHKGLVELMGAVTKRLIEETNAVVGYTQSDEITLAWIDAERQGINYFDGRIFKITSMLSAVASVEFNQRIKAYVPEKDGKLAYFDCRVWNVPTMEEAANAFLWRQRDATKNSITLAAHAYYSHQDLHRKTSAQRQEMLFQKGVNWNDFPESFKRGTFMRRATYRAPFSAQELAQLPEKHHARSNPDMEVVRAQVARFSMPPLDKVTNRIDALFFGETPKTLQMERQSGTPYSP